MTGRRPGDWERAVRAVRNLSPPGAQQNIQRVGAALQAGVRDAGFDGEEAFLLWQEWVQTDA